MSGLLAIYFMGFAITLLLGCICSFMDPPSDNVLHDFLLLVILGVIPYVNLAAALLMILWFGRCVYRGLI